MSAPVRPGGEPVVKRPEAEARAAMGSRFGNVGMPAEKAKDFKNSTRRLLARLAPERFRAIAVIGLAITSVTLSVLGPRLLGHGTNIVFRGIRSGRGIDFDALRRTLETGRTWFWSRSRQEYWCKGETSGDRQYVRRAAYDCDMDALLFVVEQEGRGACHTGERSCFFRDFGGPVQPGRV